MKCVARLLNGGSAGRVIQKCRCYHAPPPLEIRQLDRVRRQTRPFIPGQTTEVPIAEFQKSPDTLRKYKRKAYAKFGAASGVDPASLIHAKEEIEEEVEAEQRWWPTLQQMQAEIRESREIKAAKRADYEKRVAENMAKMPQWIKEWRENQEKLRQNAAQRATNRQALIEEAIERFDYKYTENDDRVKEYIREQQEKQRLLKKKAKQMAKKLKRDT